VGIFMLFVFLIIAITEISLVRQLSLLTNSSDKQVIETPQQPAMPAEFRPLPARTLAEPMQSVTENTTRTLEYSGRDPV